MNNEFFNATTPSPLGLDSTNGPIGTNFCTLEKLFDFAILKAAEDDSELVNMLDPYS